MGLTRAGQDEEEDIKLEFHEDIDRSEGMEPISMIISMISLKSMWRDNHVLYTIPLKKEIS